MTNLKSILKNSFRLLLIVVFSLVTTEVVEAKTINQSTDLLSENMLTYFNNIYEREDYKYYIVANEYLNLGTYNYTSYYYMCLTNDKIDTSNTLNVNATCDKMYRYYRSNSVYVLEEVNDNKLNVVNSIYYSYEGKNYFLEKLLILINIGLFTFYLSYVILKIFGS